MTWQFHSHESSTRTRILALYDDDRAVSHADALLLLAKSSAFRTLFHQALADLPLPAFFFETPALNLSTRHHPFELAVVATDGFAHLTADPAPFRQHLQRNESSVAVFQNLGGDATLIVPRQMSSTADYLHLAAFLRSAPAAQIDEFWRIAAERLTAQIGPAPLWLSTAGLGVSWLHLRIDSTPKYYRHAPYRTVRPEPT